MPLVNGSPCTNLDVSFYENDLIYYPFTVTDKQNNPQNFTGFTSAKMTIKNTELTAEIISFNSTGSTYQIDISSRNTGQFALNCNSLVVPAGGYVYDFVLKNSSQRQTVMRGKFVVLQNITN